ncbi:MAG: HAD-IIB family hydrolase [Actinobacteria bacterium]|nr:HAD-IIB family hydrolase [Actinomycetota bacterium]
MKRRVIAFDLDNTLTDSKSPLVDEMADLLDRLLLRFQVCVISGGTFEQFQKQLLHGLKAAPDALRALHVMPTCGTRYYRFDIATRSWRLVYAEDLTDVQKTKIVAALTKGADALGYRGSRLWGRRSKTEAARSRFSALGQEAPIAETEAWDPDGGKKRKLRDYVAKLIPELGVRVGGSTSIDVTKHGIDKAYGINKLLVLLDAAKQDVIFVGDRLSKGGNDYPVKAMGVDCLAVSRWQDTALVIQTMLGVT